MPAAATSASPSPGGSSRASSNPPLRASSPSRWSRTGMPVATFELPPPGAIRALMAARLAKSRGTNPPRIAHHRTGSHEPLQIREIWMRLVNRFCFAVLAGLVLVGSALGARGSAALGRVAERHRRGLVRERPGTRGGARPASGAGRPPDRRAPRCRAAAAGQRRALRPARRRRARHRPCRANDGAALARRARTRLPPPGLPYQWQYAAVHADQVPASRRAGGCGTSRSR